MADILIRGIKDRTKQLLKQRAVRHGRSLEAELRETLDALARSETSASSDDDQPFGSWLFSISRPGVDLDKTIKKMRSNSLRIPKFD